MFKRRTYIDAQPNIKSKNVIDNLLAGSVLLAIGAAALVGFEKADQHYFDGAVTHAIEDGVHRLWDETTHKIEAVL